jgi:hypothetical protein
MRPKLILLLVLAVGSLTFMAFLLNQQSVPKAVCEKCCPCKKTTPPPPPDSGGDDDLLSGSFNHLIVSTIK